MNKATTLFAAAAAVALALTGCAAADGGSSTPSGSGGFGECAVTGEAGSIMLDTVADGTLTVATVLPNPGWWNGTSPEAVASGYEYCMAASIAHRAGLDSVTVKNLAWDQYISGTASGYDIAIASTTITDERELVFDFTQPYFSSNLGVATAAGSDVTADNIRDVKIGVLQGNMGAEFVATVLKPNIETSIFQSQNDMFTALAAGTVDAVITDTTLALTYVQGSNGMLEVIAQYELDHGYGVVTPLGSANSATVDEVVGAMIADGTLEGLSSSYLAPMFGIDPNDVPVWSLG